MDHRVPPGAESAGTLALFPSDGGWVRTRVLDARAIEAGDFDLDAFARYRHIRILTYSSSVQMLHTVLERFAESRVECVLGYSRVVNNMASIIALQTAALEEVHGAFRGLSTSSRDAVLERVREGRLQVRVVEGHVSHAKIFLLSDGPGGDRCVLTGSANFSTSALLGDQHEVLIRFRDERAWEHFDREYLNVRDHTSAEVPIAQLVERRARARCRTGPRAGAWRAGDTARASRRVGRFRGSGSAGGEAPRRGAALVAEGGATLAFGDAQTR